MGYILPIQKDTYTQYVNRSIPVKNHYSYTQPATAITFSSLYESYKQQHQLKHKPKRAPHNQTKERKSEVLYTEDFSGKGLHINKYI